MSKDAFGRAYSTESWERAVRLQVAIRALALRSPLCNEWLVPGWVAI